MPDDVFDRASELLAQDADELWSYLLAFEPEDSDLVANLIMALRAMLGRDDLHPLQIVSLARLLLGMKRLPLVTPGLDVLVTVTTGTKDDWFSYEIGLSEDVLQIGGGGYVQGPLGGDSYGGWAFMIEKSFRSDPIDARLESLDGIRYIAAHGAVKIQDDSDESQLDWENDDGAGFWHFVERGNPWSSAGDEEWY
jgi:hypothetical protein